MYSIEYSGEKAIYNDAEEQVCIEIPRKCCMGMAKQKVMPPIEDEEIYRIAVERPVSGMPLAEIALKRRAKSACVLVSDASRAVPTHKVSGIIVDILAKAGILPENVLFVVATGVHRPASREEMLKMTGEKYAGQVKVQSHTPFDKENLIDIGVTSRGTPVEVNKAAYECDIHISVGKVEPHEFAGFSGGRKSVLPGICSARTIQTNHSPNMLYSPYAQPGVLENNPVHLDMLQAARLFRLDFTVNFVINDSQQPAGVFAGEIEACHAAAVAYLREFCGVELPRRPDVIVTSPGFPLNIDFYQSVKPLIALGEVADGNTVLALYSACLEGVQSDDMMAPFENTASLDGLTEYVHKNYRIQMDHALLLSKLLRRCRKILVHSRGLAPATVNRMYMEYCADCQGMVQRAMALTGKAQPAVLFYPMPQKSLPRLSSVLAP